MILEDVVAKISEIKGIDAAIVERETTCNAIALFDLKLLLDLNGPGVYDHKHSVFSADI